MRRKSGRTACTDETFIFYTQHKNHKEMNESKITDSEGLITAITAERERLKADRLFLLTDEHTRELCLSRLDCKRLEPYCLIEVHSGDQNKTLHSLTAIWDTLIDEGATRNSLMVNVGGGMISDIGGFAAATFKRGMHFINVPTTLLAAVDASIGGKTSINYQGLKNEIGTFSKPDAVIVNTDFFSTLDHKNRLSGFAEMVKHALISDKYLFAQMMSYDLETFDVTRLKSLIEQNINVKYNFVDLDPYDLGSRKALNLGHTIGHALEAYSYRSQGENLLHGYAVMWGLVAELYLSYKKQHLDKDVLLQMLTFAKENYGAFPFSCKEYEEIYRIMIHDKKNDAGKIYFTLLAGIGDVRINQNITKEEIFEALDFVRES